MIIARLSDTLNAEYEEMERKCRELRCELARWKASWDKLKELCREQELESLQLTSNLEISESDEFFTLTQESDNLKREISEIQTKLQILQTNFPDFAAVFALCEEKSRKEHEIETKKSILTGINSEILEIDSLSEALNLKNSQFRAKISQIHSEIRALNSIFTRLQSEKLPNCDDLSEFPSRMSVYLRDLEARRVNDVQSLAEKRREWREMEAALVEKYEKEVKELEMELGETEKTPEKEKITRKNVVKTRKMEENETGLDLESLLGNSGPSLQRIKAVTQQYRSSPSPFD